MEIAPDGTWRKDPNADDSVVPPGTEAKAPSTAPRSGTTNNLPAGSRPVFINFSNANATSPATAAGITDADLFGPPRSSLPGANGNPIVVNDDEVNGGADAACDEHGWTVKDRREIFGEDENGDHLPVNVLNAMLADYGYYDISDAPPKNGEAEKNEPEGTAEGDADEDGLAALSGDEIAKSSEEDARKAAEDAAEEEMKKAVEDAKDLYTKPPPVYTGKTEAQKRREEADAAKLGRREAAMNNSDASAYQLFGEGKVPPKPSQVDESKLKTGSLEEWRKTKKAKAMAALNMDLDGVDQGSEDQESPSADHSYEDSGALAEDDNDAVQGTEDQTSQPTNCGDVIAAEAARNQNSESIGADENDTAITHSSEEQNTELPSEGGNIATVQSTDVHDSPPTVSKKRKRGGDKSDEQTPASMGCLDDIFQLTEDMRNNGIDVEHYSFDDNVAEALTEVQLTNSEMLVFNRGNGHVKFVVSTGLPDEYAAESVLQKCESIQPAKGLNIERYGGDEDIEQVFADMQMENRNMVIFKHPNGYKELVISGTLTNKAHHTLQAQDTPRIGRATRATRPPRENFLSDVEAPVPERTEDEVIAAKAAIYRSLSEEVREHLARNMPEDCTVEELQAAADAMTGKRKNKPATKLPGSAFFTFSKNAPKNDLLDVPLKRSKAFSKKTGGNAATITMASSSSKAEKRVEAPSKESDEDINTASAAPPPSGGKRKRADNVDELSYATNDAPLKKGRMNPEKIGSASAKAGVGKGKSSIARSKKGVAQLKKAPLKKSREEALVASTASKPSDRKRERDASDDKEDTLESKEAPVGKQEDLGCDTMEADEDDGATATSTTAAVAANENALSTDAVTSTFPAVPSSTGKRKRDVNDEGKSGEKDKVHKVKNVADPASDTEVASDTGPPTTTSTEGIGPLDNLSEDDLPGADQGPTSPSPNPASTAPEDVDGDKDTAQADNAVASPISTRVRRQRIVKQKREAKKTARNAEGSSSVAQPDSAPKASSHQAKKATGATRDGKKTVTAGPDPDSAPNGNALSTPASSSAKKRGRDEEIEEAVAKAPAKKRGKKT